jgi:dehydrogenase/reductase SDR family protein 7B
MQFDLRNKVVWVTGASSGIGLALADELYNEGAKLVISARNESQLIEIKNKFPIKEYCLVLPFDLKNSAEFEQYHQQIIKNFGRCDVLINNGGFSQRSKAMETTQALEREIMEIDYFAQVALAKTVLPTMKKLGGGKIVVVSSIAGKFGFYLRSTYSAAKHALQGYFESLRLEEEGNNISVLLVYPGKIKTNISINAVLPDGNKHNSIDKSFENCMTAQECARNIIVAIKNNSEEILVGRKEILMVKIKNYFPIIFKKLIRKIKRE